MPRNGLLLALLVLFSGVSLWAQEQRASAVYFSVDSHELNPEARLQLDQLLKDLDQVDHWNLEVRAHTDATGTNDYNAMLAKRRAEAVRNYLVERDLPMDWVTISTFGEDHPAESNATEEGRSLNRRVEINLQIWNLNSLDDLMSGLREDPTQHFTFEADQSVRLSGKDGTTLWIPAGLFIHADGRPAEGTIELEMQEAYTYADMFSQGLSTHSGSKILETGGMVFLRAQAAGEQLQIKEEGELIMAMPTEQQLAGMQLFTGQTDADGNLQDWIPSGQTPKTNKLATLRIADPPPMPQVKTELTFFKFDESGEPQVPNRPIAPVHPKKPKRESVKYEPGFFKRIMLGKKKIKAEEEAIFAKKMAQYEARLARYPELLLAFHAKMEVYAQDMQNYHEAVAAWKSGMQEQWKAHQAVRMEKYKEAQSVTLEKYRKTLEAYEAYKARKIAEYEAAVEMGGMNQESLNNYFYAVNKLGWINCDRFYQLADSEKAPLMVKDTDDQEEMIFVFLKDIKSALRAQPMEMENYYTTRSIPKGTTAKVIGLKVQNGRSLMAVKEVSTGAIDAVELEYEPRRLYEIRETLAALD